MASDYTVNVQQPFCYAIRMNNDLMIIGHRGALGYELENTLASFETAISMGVDVVECDVFLSKDGQLLVLHDNKLDRTTSGTGYIKDYSYEEIIKLETNNGQKIPTLQELLDLVDKRCKVLIEIKGFESTEKVAEVIQHYIDDKGWDNELFIVQSFNFHELAKLKRLIPGIQLATLMCAIPLDYAKYAADLGATYINLDIQVATKEYVEDAHRYGLKVGVWAVNDIDDLERLRAIGIDAVITDYPDIMINARGQLTPAS